MKKLLLFGLILSCLSLETEASTVSDKRTLIKSTASNTLYKRRRKKGFLWGLFRKNDCGCPKH